MSRAYVGIAVVFGFIGLYDMAIGAWLLLSDTPWLAHGPGTLWLDLAPSTQADGMDTTKAHDNTAAATMSLFRRMGALQLVIGGATLGWVYHGRKDYRLVDKMLMIYAALGGALAWGDNTYFAGTQYLLSKQVIGAVSTGAMLGWLTARLSGKA